MVVVVVVVEASITNPITSTITTTSHEPRANAALPADPRSRFKTQSAPHKGAPIVCEFLLVGSSYFAYPLNMRKFKRVQKLQLRGYNVRRGIDRGWRMGLPTGLRVLHIEMDEVTHFMVSWPRQIP